MCTVYQTFPVSAVFNVLILHSELPSSTWASCSHIRAPVGTSGLAVEYRTRAD